MNYWDPIAREFVQMVEELVLNVRTDSTGELILLHMRMSSAEGFPIIGGGTEEFRRVRSR